MTDRSTSEGRLVDAGWIPPTERLRIVVARREAFRSAISGLKTRGSADTAHVQDAIGTADRDGIITALVHLAIGQWLDRECQRPETQVTAWSATLEQELVEAIYAAPAAVLDSLASIDSPDAAYLRSHATTAATPSAFMAGINGQPARARPNVVSFHQVMVPR